MGREVVNTRFQALNFTKDPKNLQMSELSNARNMHLRKTGEYERRPGLRPAGNSVLIDNSTLGAETIFTDSKRPKYVQVVTANRETVEIYAVGNRVFIFDEDLNKFHLLYEAPGNEDVDVAAYLGLVLVTSHSSNLAILKPYERRTFILNENNRLIKSQGIISGNQIDFVEEDELVDADIKDFTLDQSAVYTASIASFGPQSQAIDPAVGEISNLVFASNNQYKTAISLYLGADFRTGTDAISLNSEVSGIHLASQAVNTFNYLDFTNGEVTNALVFIRRVKWNVVDAGGDFVAISGLSFNGANLTAGRIRRLGTFVDFKQCDTISWINNIGDNQAAVYAYRLKVIRQHKPDLFVGDTNFSDAETYYEGEAIFHMNAQVLYWYKPDGTYFTKDINTEYNGGHDRNYFQIIAVGTTQPNSSFLSVFKQSAWESYSRGRRVAYPLSGNVGGAVTEIPSSSNGAYFSNIIWKNPADHSTSYAYRNIPAFTITLVEKQFGVKIESTGEVVFTALTGGGVSYVLPAHSSDYSFAASFDDFNPPTPNPFTQFLMSIDDTLKTQVIDVQTGTLTIRPINPYYRVASRIKGLVSKQPVNTTELWRYNSTAIYLNETVFSQRIEFQFDIAYAHSEVEILYTLTPPGTSLNRLKVNRYSKDNFDLKESILDLYGESTDLAKVAKLREIVILQRNSFGTYMLIVRRNVDQVEIISDFNLVEYGTIKDLKSITDHNGRSLALLSTSLGLFVFVIQDSTLKEVAKYVTGLAPNITDFTAFIEGGHTNIYFLNSAGSPTTAFVRLVDLAGNPAFDGNEYENLNDFRINYSSTSNNPKMLLFVTDNEGQQRIVAENTAGTPSDANRFLEFEVDGGSASAYEKILADQSLNNILQVRPRNTPVSPVVTSVASAYPRTGRFLYFWSAREFDVDGNELYESYASDPSIIASADATTLSLSLSDPYLPFNSDAVSITLSVCRLELRSSDTRIRTTDFIKLTEVGLTLTSGQWVLTTPWEDSFNSDSNGGYLTIVAAENYRGYTRYYPRCKFVAVKENIVFVLNDQKYKNNIYFAPLFDVANFQPQSTFAVEQFARDEITAVVSHNGLVVFTRSSYGIVSGIGSNISYQAITHEVGCVDDRTLKVVGSLLLCLTQKSLYWFNGYKFDKFDIPVDVITSQFVLEKSIVAFDNPFDLEYKIIYDNNKILIYSIPLQKWGLYEYPYDFILYGFSRDNPKTNSPEQVLIVRNDEPGAGSVYRFLAEDRYTVYDYLNGSGENAVTADDVEASFTTKQMDMDNGYAEKIFRRIHGEFIKSHDIKGEISINEGKFVEMVEQVRSIKFNDVPIVWHRFSEPFGSRVTDFGKRGFISTAFGNFLRDQDGKIDRTIYLKDGAYVNLGDIPQMPKGSSILFWFNQADNSVQTPIAFADLNTVEQESLSDDDRDYTKEDFDAPMIDQDGLIGNIEGIFNSGGKLGITSTAHGIVFPGPNHIRIAGLNVAVNGHRQILSIVDADNFVLNISYSAYSPAGGWSQLGNFFDLMYAKPDTGSVYVRSGLYFWVADGAISNSVTDVRRFIGGAGGGKGWWTGGFLNPNAGAVTLEPAAGLWQDFSNISNGMKVLSLASLGIGSMKIGDTFSVG